MKKRLLFLFMLVVFYSALWAQNFPRQVIATAGNTSQSGNISLSWTVGQPGPVQNTTPSDFYLTQGYQQGDEWWVSVNETVVNLTTIDLYPNPSGGLIHLKGTLPSGGVCYFHLFDNNGKLVFSDYFNAGINGEAFIDFDFSFLTTGSYYLKLTGGDDTNKYICSKKISIIH
jgi:hypothetical protein